MEERDAQACRPQEHGAGEKGKKLNRTIRDGKKYALAPEAGRFDAVGKSVFAV